MKRYTFISEMKTIALMLVVVSHCMLFYGDNMFWPELADFQSPAVIAIYGVIDASVLSAFMLASGFLLAASCAKKKRTMWQMALERTKRMLVPYYLYGALWLVPTYTFFDIVAFGREKGTGFWQGFVAMLLGQFSDHLWFLWLLIWIALFFVFTRALQDRKKVWILLVLTLVYALIVRYLLADFPYFKLSQVAPFLPCFWLGICLFQFEKEMEKIPQWGYVSIAVVCLALIVCYDNYQAAQAAAGVSLPYWVFWVVRFIGALMMYSFFRFFERTKVSEKLVATKAWIYTDRHSMNIYLLNCPFNYVYFRILYPRIGQNVFLCVMANIVLTFTSIYLTVWIQDLIKGLFRKIFPGRQQTA
ncbi:MAG: acyltransferase [Lachnospiraceae bacterium]|nr:acyltransferase [Lachnospiraceae bacterium]